MDTTQDNGDECVDNNSSVAVTQDANVYPVVISRSEIGEVCVKPEYFKCDHRSCKNTQSSCQQLVCAGLHGCTKNCTGTVIKNLYWTKMVLIISLTATMLLHAQKSIMTWQKKECYH